MTDRQLLAKDAYDQCGLPITSPLMCLSVFTYVAKTTSLSSQLAKYMAESVELVVNNNATGGHLRHFTCADFVSVTLFAGDRLDDSQFRHFLEHVIATCDPAFLALRKAALTALFHVLRSDAHPQVAPSVVAPNLPSDEMPLAEFVKATVNGTLHLDEVVFHSTLHELFDDATTNWGEHARAARSLILSSLSPKALQVHLATEGVNRSCDFALLRSIFGEETLVYAASSEVAASRLRSAMVAFPILAVPPTAVLPVLRVGEDTVAADNRVAVALRKYCIWIARSAAVFLPPSSTRMGTIFAAELLYRVARGASVRLELGRIRRYQRQNVFEWCKDQLASSKRAAAVLQRVGRGFKERRFVGALFAYKMRRLRENPSDIDRLHGALNTVGTEWHTSVNKLKDELRQLRNEKGDLEEALIRERIVNQRRLMEETSATDRLNRMVMENSAMRTIHRAMMGYAGRKFVSFLRWQRYSNVHCELADLRQRLEQERRDKEELARRLQHLTEASEPKGGGNSPLNYVTTFHWPQKRHHLSPGYTSAPGGLDHPQHPGRAVPSPVRTPMVTDVAGGGYSRFSDPEVSPALLYPPKPPSFVPPLTASKSGAALFSSSPLPSPRYDGERPSFTVVEMRKGRHQGDFRGAEEAYADAMRREVEQDLLRERMSRLSRSSSPML